MYAVTMHTVYLEMHTDWILSLPCGYKVFSKRSKRESKSVYLHIVQVWYKNKYEKLKVPSIMSPALCTLRDAGAVPVLFLASYIFEGPIQIPDRKMGSVSD